ncbi:type II toxin-antitoxin system HicB family antitoxin [Methylocella sp.]|uniref:type II toxin-antitoxin system HicB family antitoxin n=1 Tax=Methylocella sp. TaxID=1978226 RepID=UPI0035AD7F78
MTMYVGILDGDADVWGVRIPDCPGAYGGGATPEAALTSAISGLTAWADSMRKDGRALPAARTLAQIAASDDAPAANEAAVIVPLLLDAGRSVRANVTIDAGLLEAIDAEAARRGVTRSAFLASAARDKIEGRA